MKNSKKYIKRHNPYIKAFLTALIFTIICLSSYIRLSLYSGFSPKQYSSADDIDTCYSDNTKYIECHASKLYYSGYDYLAGNKMKGHYYYSLENQKCTIYLISTGFVSNFDTPPLELTDITFRAVLKKNDTNLKPLLEYMSSDLNWNYSGIARHSASTIISQYHYDMPAYIAITVISVAGFIATIIFAVLAFVNNKNIDTNKNNVIERNNNNEHNNDIVS